MLQRCVDCVHNGKPGCKIDLKYITGNNSCPFFVAKVVYPHVASWGMASQVKQALPKVFAAADGLSPDAPIGTNARGGKQSETGCRFDLLDPKALFAMARTLHHGCKYGEDNWRLISTKEHINHVLMHIFGWMAGDTQDEHLEHALTRMMMAVAMKDEEA